MLTSEQIENILDPDIKFQLFCFVLSNFVEDRTNTKSKLLSNIFDVPVEKANLLSDNESPKKKLNRKAIRFKINKGVFCNRNLFDSYGRGIHYLVKDDSRIPLVQLVPKQHIDPFFTKPSHVRSRFQKMDNLKLKFKSSRKNGYVFMYHNDQDFTYHKTFQECLTKLSSPDPPYPTIEEVALLELVLGVFIRTSFGIWYIHRNNSDNSTIKSSLYATIAHELHNILYIKDLKEKTHGPRNKIDVMKLQLYLEKANYELRTSNVVIEYFICSNGHETIYA